ncbi:unnamed protein product [Parnassius apollo]|uniref:(apollo) hypothetical protein n=1 Tax=Parnassius apollo TaxID=110799 RepID=A0A8S3XNZ5_PARAO|nr:unnamed protein product [Parnassius apollo]
MLHARRRLHAARHARPRHRRDIRALREYAAPLHTVHATCYMPAAGFTQRATLDPDTDEIFVLSVSTQPHYTLYTLHATYMPAAGFTQRATLDPDTDEIFVLSVSTQPHYTLYTLHATCPPPASRSAPRSTPTPTRYSCSQ